MGMAMGDGGHGRHDDLVDALAFAIPVKLKGIRGWLLGFVLTLLLAAYLYGGALLHVIMDASPNPISVILLSFMTCVSLVAAVLLCAKAPEGIIVSRVFMVVNAIIWVFGTVENPILAPCGFLALTHGIAGWLYLRNSVRVKNTIPKFGNYV